jgi:lipid-A-disaccharide synthase
MIGRAVGPMRERAFSAKGQDLRLFMIAGEHSGDALGGKLMAALNERRRGRIRYVGVGGEAMAAHGLVSQFAIDELAVMGPGAILGRLPLLLRRLQTTAASAIIADPDALVIIDSPEFTHRVARRVRRRRPEIPIIDYVAPSVWAWRPGRAGKMHRYIDHVLALLPFEPDAYRRLGGPPCTYVGHPLIERLAWITALDTQPLARRLGLRAGLPVVVLLPGSRPSEVARLMQPFCAALRTLSQQGCAFEIVIPLVPTVRGMIEERLKELPRHAHLIVGEEDKFRAFKLARAALAASGTVTLELALAGTPMVVGYKVGALTAAALRLMIATPSVVLANLVVGERVVPELLQENCTPDNLANALGELMQDGPQRAAQLAALAGVPARLSLPHGTPSAAASEIVLHYAERGRGWPRPELAAEC